MKEKANNTKKRNWRRRERRSRRKKRNVKNLMYGRMKGEDE